MNMWHLRENLIIKPISNNRYKLCQNKTSRILVISDFIKDILIKINDGYDEDKTLTHLLTNYNSSSQNVVRDKLKEGLKLLNDKEIITYSDSFKQKEIVLRKRDEGLDRVVMLITNICNLRCKHCDANSQMDMDIKNQELSTEEYINLLKEFENIGVLSLVITGGEPFLRGDILKILDAINDIKFDTKIFTNGTKIDDEIIDKISDMEYIRIQIGLDGINSLTHDKFRGVDGTFDRALKTIHKLTESGIRCSVGTVIHSDNINQMGEFPEFLESINVNNWVVSTVMPIGRAIGQQDMFLSDEQFKKFMQEYINIGIKKLNTNFNIINSAFNWKLIGDIQNETIEKVGRRCKPFDLSLTILPNGDITPCERLPFLVLGNIKERSVVEIIKDNDKIKKYQNFIDNLNSECNNCKYLNVCGKGCPGVILANKLMKGSSNYIDPISCRFFNLCFDHFLDNVPEPTRSYFDKKIKGDIDKGGNEYCG